MSPLIRIALLTSLVALLCTSSAVARNRHYTSASDLQIVSQSIESASVGRDLTLNGVQVEGKLAAGRNITCNDCAITGNISAGKSVFLNECAQIQNIAAGYDAEITNGNIAQNIAAGHDITLHGTTVTQRVSAGNQVALEHSEAKGLTSLGGHYALLDNSKASHIIFSEQNSGHGSGIIIGGNNFSSVRVGATGLSSINGYTVKGAVNQTTVITPEQSIYVNGQKVNGEGPAAYADYQAKHPEAPSVSGPGWTNGTSAPQKPASSKKKAENNKPVVNVLELKNGSTVSGDVQFESGYGKIVVYPGSQFQGKVVNGFVEKVSR